MATRGTPTTGEFNVREDIRRKFVKKDLTKSEWEAVKAAYQLLEFLGCEPDIEGLDAGAIHRSYDGFSYRSIEVFVSKTRTLIVRMVCDGESVMRWRAWRIDDVDLSVPAILIKPHSLAAINVVFRNADEGRTDWPYRFGGPFVGYVGRDLRPHYKPTLASA